MRFHIIIEGTDEDQMREFFEKIQNKYNLFDNCIIEECEEEDSVIDMYDRCVETGGLKCKRPKHAGVEPR